MRSSGKHERRMGTMDKILVFIAIVLVIFTGIMIWLYKTTFAVPDTLITCVFMACTGEFGVMGYIKGQKEKNQNRKWQLEDEKRQRDYLKEDMKYGR